MNRRLRTLLLVAVLGLAVLLLAGCSIRQGTIDLNQPSGLWEQIIVFPLAKILIALNNFIRGLGIPYSWGWAIIVLTVAIKIVTLPLTLKQLQSAKATQQLQPRLRELQAKYGKDRQKYAEEQMKLYKEAGVSPFGGCLPLLIQLPVLWGLYQALYVLANPSVTDGLTNDPRFYWIPDLSLPALTVQGQAAPTLPDFPSIPMAGTGWIGPAFQQQEWSILVIYFSLPVLMLVSQMLMQKMTQPAKDKSGPQDSQSRMMGQMMFFMPILFAWITLGLPAGLTLYWTVSNLLGMIQQYFVTGWGGLADWFGFLRRREPAVALVGHSSMEPTVAAAPPTPAKPVKRRRRRK